MEWQPIETAPKDGKSILVFSPKHNEQFVVQWMVCLTDETAYWVFGRARDLTLIIRDATHWMQLPKPPVESER